MTTYPAWKPATRPGIIPLRPLGFGTILGRSFTALRQNPKVLLGFALPVTAATAILTFAAITGLAIFAISRVATMSPGSPDYDAVAAGSVALVVVGSVILSIAGTAVGVVVQAVVVNEVAHAAVSERMSLRRLWVRVRPVAWRIIGYALMLLTAITIAGLAVFALLVLAGMAIGVWVTPVIVMVILGAVPLTLWLTVKLLLVPAVMVLEQTTIRRAVARSWTLTRGRFWVTLGVWLIVQVSFAILAQAISTPVSLGVGLFGGLLSPTGENQTAAVIGMLISLLIVQVIVVLIQSVAIVVSSTATALIYIDCRMRHEGLDLDLLAYVDARDDGVTDLPDPYRQHIGRVIAPRTTAPRPGYAPPPAGAAAPPPYGAAYPPPYTAAAPPSPGQAPAGYPPPPPYPAAVATTPPLPATTPPPAEEPSPDTRWTPPTGPS
ncbi:glycerophosphoryl diester phosphodiesterase membrane domain-containing protein [Microbacterium sp.]|uniref:glycerophosphoryl diester phosphodiesterase membrane domain-containing protein n=1 Tax=Microbacterium sp. TaxID=51671 RepID=UPI003A868212